ncbi:hypothetical protein ACFVAO_11900 [Streptomyces californicus]|uniref:hypothetical protein n=1 Tax=Streptomyces californicus TaxID=67351 RepID=UPI0036CC539A
MSFEPEVARLAAISDPAARAKAAAEAARDAGRLFRTIEVTALHDLVNAHGGLDKHGAVTAAAREMGRSAEAVRKRIIAAPDTGNTEPYEQEGEPGRYFASSDDAYEALLDWKAQREDLMLRGDPLVRGALAAGVSPRVVRDVTALSLDTIDRLESTSAGTAVDVPMHVWEDTVDYLADMAPALGKNSRIARWAAQSLAGVVGLPARPDGHRAELPEALRGEEFDALSVEEKVERVMNAPKPEGEEVPAASHQDLLDGPDGWAAAFCGSMESLAGSKDADFATAARKVAAVVRHVRVTGSLPEETTA